LPYRYSTPAPAEIARVTSSMSSLEGEAKTLPIAAPSMSPRPT
jgi:hypothetical protein